MKKSTLAALFVMPFSTTMYLLNFLLFLLTFIGRFVTVFIQTPFSNRAAGCLICRDIEAGVKAERVVNFFKGLFLQTINFFKRLLSASINFSQNIEVEKKMPA